MKSRQEQSISHYIIKTLKMTLCIPSKFGDSVTILYFWKLYISVEYSMKAIQHSVNNRKSSYVRLKPFAVYRILKYHRRKSSIVLSLCTHGTRCPVVHYQVDILQCITRYKCLHDSRHLIVHYQVICLHGNGHPVVHYQVYVLTQQWASQSLLSNVFPSVY